MTALREKREAHHRLMAAAGRARLEGAIWDGPTRTEWDVSGRCQEPPTVELYSRDPEGLTNPVWLILTVPCRRCGYCLRKRKLLWKDRAKAELEFWRQGDLRTWMVTLTASPEVHAAALHMAKGGDYGLNYNKARRVWERAPAQHEEFLGVHRVLSKEVTLWLKRVRIGGFLPSEKTGQPVEYPATRFRYLCVAEKHKDRLAGLPHYHLLIHELPGQPLLRKRWLQAQWSQGFSEVHLVGDTYRDRKTGVQIELTPERAAHYVAKYLGKEAAARVRSSQHYGEPWEAFSAARPSSQSIAREAQRAERGARGEIPFPPLLQEKANDD